MKTKEWRHETVKDAMLVVLWKIRIGIMGLVANLASHAMNKARMRTPDTIKQMTVAEFQGASPPEPASRPYKKQIVPPMIRTNPIQSRVRSPSRRGSFSISTLRAKNKTTKAIPSKGRLM